MNYLTVELLTILYPLFLFTQNKYPIVMALIIIVHGTRLCKNINYVNKDFKPNLIIMALYTLLTLGLFKTGESGLGLLTRPKQFIIFGIMYGLLQYITYIQHEKQNKTKYAWLKMWIDPPITIMSSYISYQGYKANDLYLAPFLGDIIYHGLEFLTKN